MDSEIGNIETAECERLLSGNVVQAQIYGSKKEPGAQTAMMADNDQRPPNPSKTLPQYIAALAATGGAFAAGTTLGWTSPIKAALINGTGQAGNYEFPISDTDFSLIGSLVTLGAALVCLFIGTIIQIVGRKLTMLLLVIPFTVGWALVTLPTNLAMLECGRFLLGISGGAFCVAAPTYTGEIAQTSIRGSLGSYFQLMLVLGVLFSYIVGGQANVFTLNLICACIPIIFAIVFVFMPESPAYLISKGKKEAAAKSLKWLRGSEYDYSQELAELQAQHEADKNNKVSLTAALSRRSTIKAVYIGLGLMFFQQMSGINAVIFYTKDIFEAAKTGVDSGLATIIVGVMQVISVFISSIIVDKLGRRLLLLPSAIIMALCTILLGTYFYMQGQDEESVASIGWLPIVSMCVFIILFSLGFGPIPWMMMGELFSNDIKGVAGSAAGALNWSVAFFVTSTFNWMNNTFGKGETFWIFSLFCILGAVFVFIFVPETKGKSLPDIQRMLAGEKIIGKEHPSGTTTVDSKTSELWHFDRKSATMSQRDEQQPLLQSNRTQYESIRSENELDPIMVAENGLGHAKRLPQYSATIAATTGALAAGAVLGWSSPAETYIVTQSAYNFTVTDEQYSWISSFATIGGIISCLVIGLVMDIVGRKSTMLLLIIPFSFGWALIIWPISVAMLYIGRFSVGFAGGAFFVVAPAYIGEIASKDIRGTLSSCLQLMITIGILFAYVFGHFFSLNTFNAICAILPLIFGAIFVWMPESPYFYIMKNRPESAENALIWLRGSDYNINDELMEIQIEHNLMIQNKTSILTALNKSSTKRALTISLTLVILVQFSGINAVIFYTSEIFRMANAGIESTLATIIVGTMQVIATFVASLTVDRLGRRFLLSISASIMFVCNIGLGIYFFLQDHNSPYIDYLNWLPIFSLCVYIIAFSLGCGPIPWVLVSEIFATEAKAIASSLTGSTSWLIAFLVTKFFTNVKSMIGVGQTFFMFAGFAALCTLFVISIVPETKGKTFNEIQRSLHGEDMTSVEDENENSTSVTI
ncbi:uncharacterized protein LOC116345073 [Contarinia nasturtii]|uniref:uncharacterized protein LOC116345073 n=1 Tax=Contarinia nasturtii TaxID=265458 RepID=UPI0012D37D01|nr:uncharacterized protein LOC116345073 [Contarinia nasturtii]